VNAKKHVKVNAKKKTAELNANNNVKVNAQKNCLGECSNTR
jgi:hypothetical protein